MADPTAYLVVTAAQAASLYMLTADRTVQIRPFQVTKDGSPYKGRWLIPADLSINEEYREHWPALAMLQGTATLISVSDIVDEGA